MSNFNPFAVGTETSTTDTATATATVLSAPVAEGAVEAAVVAAPAAPVAVEVVDGVTVATTGLTKSGKPRKQRSKNAPISKEMKAEMIKRYSTETPGGIAQSMGLEARQVYNVVRNSRIMLEQALETETDEAKKALISAKLELIPHKEFGGGAAGPRTNTLTIDDILNMI